MLDCRGYSRGFTCLHAAQAYLKSLTCEKVLPGPCAPGICGQAEFVSPRDAAQQASEPCKEVQLQPWLPASVATHLAQSNFLRFGSGSALFCGDYLSVQEWSVFCIA